MTPAAPVASLGGQPAGQFAGTGPAAGPGPAGPVQAASGPADADRPVGVLISADRYDLSES